MKLLLISILFMPGCSEWQTVFGCSLQMQIILYTLVIESVIIGHWLDRYEGTELTKENLMLYHVTRGE